MSNTLKDAFKEVYARDHSPEDAERLAEIAAGGYSHESATLEEAFRYLFLEQGQSVKEAERLAGFATEGR